MSLRESFTTAVKDAMKSGDKQRLSTVRLVQAALKDKDIEARGEGQGPIADTAILSLLQKMIKQSQETLETAEKVGRPELADGARAEIAILSSFLPQQMGEAETRAAVDAAIAETAAASVKDMGKVMAVLKAKHAGAMDFGRAGAVVKAALGG
jgi:uncharacterized protein